MNAPVRLQMTALEWGMLLLLSVIWGASFFFVGVAVKELPPFTIVALRVALAALTLWAMLALMRHPILRSAAVWRSFLVLGFINCAVPFSLIAWGQTHIASALAAILNATMPLFTVVATHFLTSDDRMTGGRIAGIVAGLIGVAIFIGPDAVRAVDNTVLGQCAILSAAICYALGTVYGRRLHKMNISPIMAATGQLTAANILILPVALFIEQPWRIAMPSWEGWGAIFGLAVLSTALAYLLYFRILSRAGATNISLVTFLIPVSATIFGVLFLGEWLELRHLGGMFMIAVGLACVDGRIFKLALRRPARAPI